MTNRLILLAVVLVGLIILLVQNTSPSLPLVFLGMQTQPLPLALWILFSIIAGGVTSFLTSTLFKFISNTPQQLSTPSSKLPRTKPRSQRTPRTEQTTPSSSYTKAESREEVSQDNYDSDYDDWETDDSQADDWDFDQPTSRKQSYPEDRTDETSDETSENVTRRNTIYSYSSEEPKNTGVGKVESVYDADYRVIIPPHQSSSTNQNEDDQDDDYDDDDWSFFEDDDFEDDEEDKKKPNR